MATIKYKTNDGFVSIPIIVPIKSNAEQGIGIGTCVTVAATTAKEATLTNYELVQNGIVSITFTYAVPANATLNINNKGAKAIYYKGAAITANVINSGDTVSFVYDGTNYVLTGGVGGPYKDYLPLTGGTLTGQVGATGFVKSDSSDSYVLLGGGGHKLESDLSVASAGSARVATILGKWTDNRSTDNLPSYYYENGFGGCGAVSSELAFTGSAHGWYETRITTVPWWDTSGGRPVQLALANSGAYLRTAASRTQWNQWQTIITSANIGSYMHNIYDAEIEYLESTGTQWIDTLYKPNNNTRITCDFQYTESNSYPRIFGCSSGTKWNSVPNFQLDFQTGVASGTLLVIIGNNTDWTNTNITGDFNKHSYDLTTTRLIYDGTQVATYSDQTFQCTVNLAIFTRLDTNNAPIANESAIGKLYSFQIYESDELVRDFIPVRVGQIGYLYDKVSGQLFGNSGTGDFVLGQDTGPGGGMSYIPTVGTAKEGWIGTASPSYKLNVNGDVSATGFVKSGSSDSYVLLGGGGHKLLSDLASVMGVTTNIRTGMLYPGQSVTINAEIIQMFISCSTSVGGYNDVLYAIKERNGTLIKVFEHVESGAIGLNVSWNSVTINYNTSFNARLCYTCISWNT